MSMGEIYIDGNVNDSIHLSNIVALSSRIKNEHGAILTGGSFRIGAAQKALNLYLKYRWARNLIKAPPHCPIDRVIIDEIKKRDPNRCSCSICKTTMWTKMDNIEEYEHLIERARSAAGNEGYDLPHWELKIWQEQIQKSNRKSQKLNPVS